MSLRLVLLVIYPRHFLVIALNNLQQVEIYLHEMVATCTYS